MLTRVLETQVKKLKIKLKYKFYIENINFEFSKIFKCTIFFLKKKTSTFNFFNTCP